MYIVGNLTENLQGYRTFGMPNVAFISILKWNVP